MIISLLLIVIAIYVFPEEHVYAVLADSDVLASYFEHVFWELALHDVEKDGLRAYTLVCRWKGVDRGHTFLLEWHSIGCFKVIRVHLLELVQLSINKLLIAVEFGALG